MKYTIAEKEAIMKDKIAQIEKENIWTFYVDGENFTLLMRDAWVSGLVKKAIIVLGVEGLGLKLSDAIKVCTGESMLIGDSRIENNPGFIELHPDDGRFKNKMFNCDIPTMISYLEKNYRELMGIKSQIDRDLNLQIPIPSSESFELKYPFGYSREKGGSYSENVEEMLNNKNKINLKLPEILSGLEILYPYVGKSMADLPIDIDIIPSSMERREIKNQWRQIEQFRDFRKKERNKTIINDTSKKETYEPKFLPITDDSFLKYVGSAWILPDGSIFGDRAVEWIHLDILNDLEKQGILKKLSIENDEKSAENAGFLKLSNGQFLYYTHIMKTPRPFTKKQQEKIIDWCLANDKDKVYFNSKEFNLNEFCEKDPSEICRLQ